MVDPLPGRIACCLSLCPCELARLANKTETLSLYRLLQQATDSRARGASLLPSRLYLSRPSPDLFVCHTELFESRVTSRRGLDTCCAACVIMRTQNRPFRISRRSMCPPPSPIVPRTDPTTDRRRPYPTPEPSRAACPSSRSILQPATGGAVTSTTTRTAVDVR